MSYRVSSSQIKQRVYSGAGAARLPRSPTTRSPFTSGMPRLATAFRGALVHREQARDCERGEDDSVLAGGEGI